MHPVRLLRPFALALALLATGGAALAQSPACQRYRAELAALGRGGGNPQAAAAAQRQQAELARMSGYYRSIGCDRGGFIFFGQVPAECGSIAQRIQSMQANLQRLQSQADPYGGEQRRQQLAAAVEQACAPQREAGARGFFDSLFGAQPQRGEQPQIYEEAPPEERPGRALGGRRLVCVRTCDGSFFPLNNPTDGREGADAMCQALCPNVETAAYYMPQDGDIENAISTSGRPYVQLPNASKFKRAVDTSCSCRREGQSWAQALQQAEAMIERRRGDIVVTAAKAEELSRPLPAPARGAQDPRLQDPQRAQQDRTRRAVEPPRVEGPLPEEAREAAAAASAPTASTESSGIGAAIEDTRVVGRGDGQRREVTTETGARRTVRVVAPNVIPVPVPAAPAR